MGKGLGPQTPPLCPPVSGAALGSSRRPKPAKTRRFYGGGDGDDSDDGDMGHEDADSSGGVDGAKKKRKRGKQDSQSSRRRKAKARSMAERETDD